MTRLTFKLITFGCRLNQAESRMIGESLVSQFPNLRTVGNQDTADIVIINSCSVTQKADKEVRQTIRRIKRENPNCFLVICGCWGEKALKLSNQKLYFLIDLLIGNKDKLRIPLILKQNFSCLKKTSAPNLYKDKYAISGKALIKIQEGCNNFCTYCIVPFLRGRPVSRSANQIIKEINRKVKEGINEVILTGVEISNYQPNLVKLIRKILKQTKIEKISFGSININAFDEEFISLYKDQKTKYRLTNHFHIPLQSGCNNVLERMGRKYGTENFFGKLQILTKIIPNFSFSTDIIVGFPGETTKEFKVTISTLKKIKNLLGDRFKKIHVFRYSARKGTVAAAKEGTKGWEKVSEKLKTIRSKRIRELLNS